MVRAKNPILQATETRLPIRADYPTETEIITQPYFTHEEASEDEFYREELPDDAELDEEEVDDDERGRRDSLMTTSTTGSSHWAKKDKRVFKSLRHFSYNLLNHAIETLKWEEEQIVDLIQLLQLELKFDEERLFKLLERSEICSPSILASLSDKGVMRFTTVNLISALLKYSKSMDKFVHVMGQALEYDLFDLYSPVKDNDDSDEDDDDNEDGRQQQTQSSLELICRFAEDSMDLPMKKRYAAIVCQNLPHKGLCGKALHHITYCLHRGNNEQPREVAKFIADIIVLESFRDVSGPMKAVMAGLSEGVREELKVLLDENFDVDSDGEIRDSDEDSNGNLRDFIDPSDEEDEDEEGEDSDVEEVSGFVDEDEDVLKDRSDRDDSSDSDDSSEGDSSGLDDSDDDHKMKFKSSHKGSTRNGGGNSKVNKKTDDGIYEKIMSKHSGKLDKDDIVPRKTKPAVPTTGRTVTLAKSEDGIDAKGKQALQRVIKKNESKGKQLAKGLVDTDDSDDGNESDSESDSSGSQSSSASSDDDKRKKNKKSSSSKAMANGKSNKVVAASKKRKVIDLLDDDDEIAMFDDDNQNNSDGSESGSDSDSDNKPAKKRKPSKSPAVTAGKGKGKGKVKATSAVIDLTSSVEKTPKLQNKKGTSKESLVEMGKKKGHIFDSDDDA